ncbi:MAG: LytR/AlgR family response regulator transcription factor [Bacteroidia bacterium]
MQDLLEAIYQNSAFYLSESFLFSSFWWLFIPLLYAQFKLGNVKVNHRVSYWILLIGVPILIHLISFPAIIWLFSKIFYEYTFRYLQTFEYTISVHLYQLVLFYAAPILLYHFIKEKAQIKPTPAYELVLTVNEGTKYLSIAVADILYFTANTPYINIHLRDKQYLYKESLKTLTNKLDPGQFVRIHKSTIVNVKHVQSYTSRLNGDYDLTLEEGEILRISRNFAVNFKERYRVALK